MKHKAVKQMICDCGDVRWNLIESYHGHFWHKGKLKVRWMNGWPNGRISTETVHYGVEISLTGAQLKL